MTWWSRNQYSIDKGNERRTAGLCAGCGKERNQCACRQFHKHWRKRIPELFRGLRKVKEPKVSDRSQALAFRQQTLRITKETADNNNEDLKIKKVEDMLDGL